ncbi:MAG: hypothetical protein DDT18_01694 [Actinobacteria bacterium]|nr:hypothetical protein [Actinomycetota bacterium]
MQGNVGIGTTAPGTLLTLRRPTTGNVFAIRNIGDTADTFTITDTGIVNLGTWQGTAIGAIYGGTGQTAVATGDILFGSATNTWSRLAVGASGTVLVGGTIPSWSASPSLTSLTLTGTTPLTLTGTSPVTITRNTITADILAIDNLGTTGTLSLNLVDGGLQFAGITRITNTGVATFTGLTSSGTITFSGLTADRLVTTTTGGTLTTSITSANLAASVTDETGSGLLVFNTSPSFTTSLVTGSASFDLFNTTATTINAFGTATALTIGATSGTTTIRNTNLALSADSAVLNFSSITGTKQIQTGGTTHLALMPGGNVGIGTISPGRRLEVLNAESVPQLRLSQSATVFSELFIDSAGDLRVSATGQDIRALDENLWVCAAGACPAGAPSGTGNLIVEGSVGIGTTSPAGNLHVASGTITANTPLTFTQTWNAAGVTFTGMVLNITDTASAAGSGLLNVQTGGVSRLFVRKDGNVGIGTTAPGARLDVNGNIRSRNINTLVWSVYEPDNILRSYTWQSIFNSAKAAGLVAAGSIYDCVIKESNPAHYRASRFTVGVNLYDNHNNILQLVNVDGGFLGGCSQSLHNVTTIGFDYQRGNCFQSLSVVCNMIGQ